MLKIIVILVIIGIYFIPSMIAYLRNKKDRFSILALNIFLGWTVAGWIGSLVWSLWEEEKKAKARKVEPLDIESEKNEIKKLEGEVDKRS